MLFWKVLALYQNSQIFWECRSGGLQEEEREVPYKLDFPCGFVKTVYSQGGGYSEDVFSDSAQLKKCVPHIFWTVKDIAKMSNESAYSMLLTVYILKGKSNKDAKFRTPENGKKV